MIAQRHLRFTSVVSVFALLVAIQSSGQTTSPPVTSLQTLVVDDGKDVGDVVLKVDFDATGSAGSITPISGPAELYASAERVTRLFRHPRLAGVTAQIQTVYFLVTANGIRKTKPIYPPIAKAAHVAGTVELVASVAADGHVNTVTTLSGPAMLMGSASDAVRQWKYPPISLDDVPVPFQVIVDVEYKL